MNLKAHLIAVGSIVVVVGTIYVFDHHQMIFSTVGAVVGYCLFYRLIRSMMKS